MTEDNIKYDVAVGYTNIAESCELNTFFFEQGHIPVIEGRKVNVEGLTLFQVENLASAMSKVGLDKKLNLEGLPFYVSKLDKESSQDNK